MRKAESCNLAEFPLLYTAMAASWPVLGPFSLLGSQLGPPPPPCASHYRSRALHAVLRIWIRDPGPFWPLDPDPGSGIGFFRIPDPRSQTHIFESLTTNFWVKSSIILWKLFFLQHLKNKIIFNFVKFMAKKRYVKKKFSSLSFVAVFGSEIRGPGSGIRDG